MGIRLMFIQGMSVVRPAGRRRTPSLAVRSDDVPAVARSTDTADTLARLGVVWSAKVVVAMNCWDNAVAALGLGGVAAIDWGAVAYPIIAFVLTSLASGLPEPGTAIWTIIV